MSGKTRRHAVAWDGVVIPLHRTESSSIWHSSFTQTNKQIMALHNSFILKSQAVKLRLVAGHSWKSLGNRVQWERVLKKPHGLNDIFIVLQAIFFHHQMVSRRSSSKLPTKCKCQKKKKKKKVNGNALRQHSPGTPEEIPCQNCEWDTLWYWRPLPRLPSKHAMTCRPRAEGSDSHVARRKAWVTCSVYFWGWWRGGVLQRAGEGLGEHLRHGKSSF